MILTNPEWQLAGSSAVSEETGNSENGSVKAVYNTQGMYDAKLTLTNGWGSDTKTFSYVQIDNTGALSNESISDAYKVFPNPFIEELNLQFLKSGNYQIEVVNLAGQLVSKKILTVSDNEFIRINVNGPKGTYLVSVKENGKLLKVMKVIKEQ